MKYINKIFLKFVVILLVLIGSIFISAKEIQPISSIKSSVKGLDIPNAHLVLEQNDTKIYRSNAVGTLYQAENLKKFGVKKVLIFKRQSDVEVDEEISLLKKVGYAQEDIERIDFEWKKNSDYNKDCKMLLKAHDLLDQAIQNKTNMLFHCTVGEDRTGILAATYLMRRADVKDFDMLFKNEMCLRGYESGDKEKPKEVVQIIREGLSLRFLKFAYVILKYKKNNQKIDESICDYNFDSDKEFKSSSFSSIEKYNCDNELFKQTK